MINQNLVKKLKLTTQKAARARSPNLFNGTKPMICDTITTFELDVGGFREKHAAWVVPNLSDETLIGYPWLKRDNAVIDCENDTIRFKKSGITVFGWNIPSVVEPEFIRRIFTSNKITEQDQKDLGSHAVKVFRASMDNINKVPDRLSRDCQPADPERWKLCIPSWVAADNISVFDPDAQFTKNLPPRR
ncbi:hypothetical protein Cpir12675_006832 [Ceratocystis pirilliformis]|uniref:Uncharacterized protein n=1 Tax=Ceratocystis pirilliformis TaxID=259994 RepID=A0ABR3YF69_9PEZI